jgi:ABC-2 type transport system ATP-binding protein
MFALQLQNVYLKIRKHQILKDISFSIPPKKICVFIGENGAGKSSTIRCILGLQKITYGTGSIFGKSIFNYQSRQNVSFVPDIEQFIDISVRQ